MGKTSDYAASVAALVDLGVNDAPTKSNDRDATVAAMESNQEQQTSSKQQMTPKVWQYFQVLSCRMEHKHVTINPCPLQ